MRTETDLCPMEPGWATFQRKAPSGRATATCPASCAIYLEEPERVIQKMSSSGDH